MNVEIFTVFDSAAKRYLEPFFAETIEVAMRMFGSLVAKEGHQFNRFPEDYSLFHIGSYDAMTGGVSPLREPHSLGVALAYVPGPVPHGELLADVLKEVKHG